MPGKASSEAIADNWGRRPPLRFRTSPKCTVFTSVLESWPLKPAMIAFVQFGVKSWFNKAFGLRMSSTRGDELLARSRE